MPTKTFNIIQDDLYKLFIEQNLSRKQVAEHYGCSEVLVKKKCQQYGIKKPKFLESRNKERKEVCRCLWCGVEYLVSRFRSKNHKWISKYCSPKCSSDSRYLGAEHKRAMLNSVSATRRANMSRAFDKNADRNKINEFYVRAKLLSKQTGTPHEVDHIIPISKGGKHNEHNLQILTRAENRRKASKYVPKRQRNDKRRTTKRTSCIATTTGKTKNKRYSR